MWSITAVLEGKVAGILPKPELDRLETVAHWCRSYLLQGHPGLGRAGPVCPWCPPSVAQGNFHLTHANVRFNDEASIIADLCRTRDRYVQMLPDSGPDLLLKTVVVVLSFIDKDPDSDEVKDWMIRVHEAAKPNFLSRGLMLGEFFPNHSATGLRSDTFNPLQSPIPLFVIRAMVPLDITFLSNRREYADAYFARFAEDSTKHIRDILNISPKRLARTRLRSLLQCLCWYRLGNADIDGRDIITGALVRELGRTKLQRILNEDRTFRPLVTTVVFQPPGLGKSIEEGSLEHLEWLWRTAHVLRRAAGTGDFVFRDGERLVAVLCTSNPLDVRRVAELVESADELEGIRGAVSGRATEAVRHPYSEEWEWDGTDLTSGSNLLDCAYADLFQRETACKPIDLMDVAGASSGHN